MTPGVEGRVSWPPRRGRQDTPARGARVCCTGRDKGRLDAVVQECKDAGGDAFGVIGDLTSMEECQAVMAACVLGLGVATLAGCPGTLEDKYLYEDALEDAGNVTTDAGPCGNVITRIFVPSCGDTGCHGAVAPA